MSFSESPEADIGGNKDPDKRFLNTPQTVRIKAFPPHRFLLFFIYFFFWGVREIGPNVLDLSKYGIFK